MDLFGVQWQRGRLSTDRGLELKVPDEIENGKKKKKKEKKNGSKNSQESLKPCSNRSDNHEPARSFTHFLGYGNGKCAVRLRPGQGTSVWVRSDGPPYPHGVHDFMATDKCHDQMDLVRGRADNYAPTCPVVLHYANCGYKYWVAKYRNLQGISVAAQMNCVPAHHAAHHLASKGNEQHLKDFYKLFVMGNELGELPYLVARGHVVCIEGVRQVVHKARRLRGCR